MHKDNEGHPNLGAYKLITLVLLIAAMAVLISNLEEGRPLSVTGASVPMVAQP